MSQNENGFSSQNSSQKCSIESGPSYSMPVDFFTVAVHEIGHSLGLSHSPDKNSIMFPYYKGKEDGDNFNVGYDDILAMFELYGE